MRGSRPVMRYHGGKWRLADWIISHFPPHRIYVESFGGGGSVLIRKKRSYAEVYNDLDGEIVNLFKVLRDNPEPLIRGVSLTPFAREEFNAAYEPSDDPIEQARKTLVKASMGFGSAAVTERSPTLPGAGFKATTGFRANSNRSGTAPAHDWVNVPDNLRMIVERLRGVVIENRDAKESMLQHDSPETLHYVDPPYIHTTRRLSQRRKPQSYRFEMSDADHESLAEFLHGLKGPVVLSGYPSPLYGHLYVGWAVVRKACMADGARPRDECLWLSPKTVSGIQMPLLEVA